MEEEKSDQDRIAEIEAILRDAGRALGFVLSPDPGFQWEAGAPPLPPPSDTSFMLPECGFGSTKLEAAESLLADLRSKE